MNPKQSAGSTDRCTYKLTHMSLHECASPRICKALWDEALAYLKKTGDVDGWHVIIYGA